ncbi:MAG TPA: CaiB/BaiF CoA-transferase family protein, partial [Azospirillaceae bacterium]|nr:CaiB/BaiF CoA-transferase family protein [Azospirillaceae bacterium]
VALSGYGQDGPYRLRAGHDLTYMALGGALIANGPAVAPTMPFPPVSDHASALQAVLAVCAALFGRERTGKGAYLDVSMMESVLGWQGVSVTYGVRGADAERGKTLLTGGAAFYNVYRTADGRFAALGPIEEKFWRAFCTAVDRPDWIARQDEPLPQTVLIGEVAALFASKTLGDWQAILEPADCCFEPLPTFAELPTHPHVAARGQVRAVPGANPPLVETLLGLRVDGGPPPDRAPLRQMAADAVLAEWGL